jgi:peptide/nickel transport system permease protein
MAVQQANAETFDQPFEYQPRTWSKIVLRQLSKNKGAMIGLAILVLMILVAIFAPTVAPYDPTQQSRDSLVGPSPEHLMGTDVFGRDILSRIIFGSRVSLRIGLFSVGIGVFIGLTLGLIGGYYGGNLDALLVMFIDAMLAFPGILLALAIVAVLGPSLTNVMVAVGISSAPSYARLVRGSVLTAREQIYVDSARVVGCSDMRIIFRHILPNVIGPVLVLATLGIPTAILSAAGLSFLGLGAQPPTPEWGLMVSEGRKFLRNAWWIATFPGLAIMVVVLSINMFGDGLRDAIDPRLRT